MPVLRHARGIQEATLTICMEVSPCAGHARTLWAMRAWTHAGRAAIGELECDAGSGLGNPAGRRSSDFVTVTGASFLTK